jgi:hypothetical protein
MSVPPYWDRILTELRQLLELGTVTIVMRLRLKHFHISRTISYCPAGCGGLGGGTWTAFG